MKCIYCDGRWVALSDGATHVGGRSSYHFATEALECPHCRKPGEVDHDVLLEHQRHPQVVVSHA